MRYIWKWKSPFGRRHSVRSSPRIERHSRVAASYQDKVKAVEEVQARHYEGTKMRCENSKAGMDTACGMPQVGICGMSVGQGRRADDKGADGGGGGGFAIANGAGIEPLATVRPCGQLNGLQVAEGSADGRRIAAQLSEATATISRALHAVEDAFRASLAAAVLLEVTCRVVVRGGDAEVRLDASVLPYAAGLGLQVVQASFSGAYDAGEMASSRLSCAWCRQHFAAWLLSRAVRTAAPRRHDPGGCVQGQRGSSANYGIQT